jgi:hypothetical protein
MRRRGVRLERGVQGSTRVWIICCCRERDCLFDHLLVGWIWALYSRVGDSHVGGLVVYFLYFFQWFIFS